MSGALKATAKTLGLVLLGSLAALTLAGAALETPPGKRWLAAELGRYFSDAADQVAIDGIAGVLPFDFTVGAITVSDARGPRIAAKGLRVAIAPGALLNGRLVFRELTLAALDLERGGQPATEGGAAFPHLPLAVALRHGEIAALHLGPELIGTAATLSVSASATAADGTAQAELAARRIDGVPGEARFRLTLGGTPATLHLAADVAEPTGTILAGLLHRREPLPLAVTLAGDGPLDDWRGQLGATAGSAASLQATLRVSGSAPYRLAASGSLRAAELLPDALRPLAGDQVGFAAQASIADDAVILERLSLDGAAAKLSANGRYRFSDDAVGGAADLVLPDLAPFGRAFGIALGGSGSAHAELAGTLDRPRVALALAFDRPRLAAGAAQAASATLSLSADGDPLASPIAISGSGQVAGLSPVPAPLRQRIDWSIGATFDLRALSLAVENFSATAGGATVAGAATLAAGTARGEARLTLPDVAAFDGGALAGALDLAADFDAAADGGATAVLSGGLDVRPDGGALAKALGNRMTIAATLRRDAAGSLALSEAEITAAAGTFTAQGERTPGGALAGRFALDLPRLQALDARFAGTATLHGTLGGSDAAPKARLTATAKLAGQAIRASADAGYAKGVATLGALDLAAGGATLEGSASYAFATGRAQASLKGAAPDLAAWSALAGVKLAGRATAALRLEAGNRVAVTLDAAGLGADEFTTAKFHLAAEITDPFGRPRGQAQATLAAAAVGAVKLDSASLAARSTAPGRFALELAAKGKPFELAARASLTAERGAYQASVASLAGTLGGAPVRLTAPLELSWRDGTARVSGLALSLGKGRLTGAGAAGPKLLALRLAGRDVPVAPFGKLAGSDAFDGQLAFDLTLGGSRAAPAGELTLDGQRLRLAAASRPDLPTLALVAHALWQNGRVDFAGRLAGPADAAIGWRGSAPLTLDPARLALHLPADGALALHLEGAGELADLVDLLPLGEERIAGRFRIDASLAGTVGDPKARGTLGVTDGSYEDPSIGAALTSIAFTMTGDRDRMVLKDFSGGDGAGGALKASGALELAGPQGPHFDLAATLVRLRALARDEGTATASGSVRLAGPLDAPSLQANLTIDQAELAVPKRLPQDLRPVEATMIDSRTAAVIDGAGAPPPSRLVALALEVRLAMPGKVFVRGRGLDSEWRGALTLTGTAAAPRLAGSLQTVRGTFDFLGKTFVLDNGSSITFPGEAKIDPRIAIVARAQSSTITAVVRISGTALDPKIDLSSEPQLPRDEILSQLLFGASLNQISAAQGVAIASAAASLASGGDLDPLTRLRQGLGLDRLSLGSSGSSVLPTGAVPAISQPGAPGSGPPVGAGTTPLGLPPPAGAGGSLSGTALNAGKYVANGVYVGVSQGLDAASSTVNVDVDVNRHITVTTQAGQATGSGLGINWKLDY